MCFSPVFIKKYLDRTAPLYFSNRIEIFDLVKISEFNSKRERRGEKLQASEHIIFWVKEIAGNFLGEGESVHRKEGVCRIPNH